MQNNYLQMDNKFCSVKPLRDNTLPQVFIETYGCQMNVNDSEVVLSVLQRAGYSICDHLKDADIILINTCSIRDNAEQRVWGRLDVFLQEKKSRKGVIVGVLGCMAERLKEELLRHPAVDIVAGPDAYRDIPKLIAALKSDAGKLWFTSLTSGIVVGIDKIVMLIALIVFRIGWWATRYIVL